jgi:hypothetical protein
MLPPVQFSRSDAVQLNVPPQRSFLGPLPPSNLALGEETEDDELASNTSKAHLVKGGGEGRLEWCK